MLTKRQLMKPIVCQAVDNAESVMEASHLSKLNLQGS